MHIREKVAWIGCLGGIVVALISTLPHLLSADRKSAPSSGATVNPVNVFDVRVDLGVALQASKDERITEADTHLKSAMQKAQGSQAFSGEIKLSISAAAAAPKDWGRIDRLIASAAADLRRLGEIHSESR